VLTHVVIHGAIYVGSCVLRNHGASWRVRRPLWESLVRLNSAMGEADLAVFQWWLKSLSDSEIDRHTLGDRYRAHVEQPTLRPEALAPILAEVRPIPRLAKVRYDTLHKHLRAHLPEMRDLGTHFPSAERFAELRFRHLDFQWLGGARMLLVHGPAERGVHLFWLIVMGSRRRRTTRQGRTAGRATSDVAEMLCGGERSWRARSRSAKRGCSMRSGQLSARCLRFGGGRQRLAQAPSCTVRHRAPAIALAGVGCLPGTVNARSRGSGTVEGCAPSCARQKGPAQPPGRRHIL
jgi:hypothetical protein